MSKKEKKESKAKGCPLQKEFLGIEGDPDEIIFFCKDCSNIVDAEKCGNRYVYKTKKCGTKNVAFGSRKSIVGFYKLEEKAKIKAKELKKLQNKNEKIKV
jgi:hypothetical protein